MNSKPWYESSTLWVNALSAILLIINQFTPLITDPKAIQAIGGAVVVINLLLRLLKSNEPIAGTPPAQGLAPK